MGQIIMPVLRPLLCCLIQNTYFAVYGIGDILGDFPTRKYPSIQVVPLDALGLKVVLDFISNVTFPEQYSW